ncbi:acyl-CoA dehydrogenase [Streptomyces alfalfae]|uniref:Acyl-CoA dehydrogenase n=1 Tax=Streptomyces alfalfae TaxID=1642299 RepID=A0A1P8TQF5_9ACTN|nr:acyl-CoA dehydrogenase family protein [Streptomyces alfalfae]AYA20295.1 acyl-CoA dehydrogenase [Streptomyces fradiae]APY89841.1 acyl-CoA dehydrogenase [Streptomyces alfalfae]QQC87670.1 acyl-CoA dehydrogenase family protein [Streptomyces alfalfae]QUI30099.1 acyl-CoA dehydrogenase family protein [Streptomyces alfalfae]RXX42660.1 acyl-CoA dehydrogenase [Streptomyces alfalfae]
MGVATAPAVPAPESEHVGPGREHWLRVARETADDLATDATARDQAGKAPFDEVSRLREAGLLTLLAPAGAGGGGADWPTAYAVVREIAAADSSIAQLLGSHYFLSGGARFFAEPALADRVERRTAAEGSCWGGGFAHREPPLTLTRSGEGYTVSGRQSHTTGVLVADRVAVRAMRGGTGEPLAVVVDTTRPGVRIDDDADTFGQRLAGGGTVEFDAVRVTGDDVLGSLSADEDILSPPAALASPVGRLLAVQLRLGIAEGVLAEAREYSRAGHAARQPAWPVEAPGDPHALTMYGELTVLTRSASALGAQALDAVGEGLARGATLSYDEYAEISVLVAMAEAAAADAVRESTTRALDIVGAASASARLGFDRFWRNARTHALHAPGAHRLRDVGDFVLNGAHPPFVLPS